MHRLAVIVVLGVGGACEFSRHDGLAPPGDDAPDAAPQAPDGTVARAPCATADATGLVACFEIDDGVGDGVLEDSSPAKRDAATTGLGAATRGTSPAAQVGASSETRVPHEAALDLPAAYTISVWVRPDALPEVGGGVYGIVDHEQQYAMLISNSAVVGLQNKCVHTGVARSEYTERLPVGAWSFLACTWDGVELCASRWTGAGAGQHERYCHKPVFGPAPAGAHGLAIGHLSDGGAAHSRFGGALDSLQVYRRAMSADQLCAQVGQGPGCLPCDLCEP
ncbi:MAG: hypothetical protein KIT31_11215 [Deltaproteobacteria bacterium]|nr:hypothetical protein [Deltaproteobacteria bacterium]